MTDVRSQQALERRLRSTFRTKAEQLAVRATSVEIDLSTAVVADGSPRRRRRTLLGAAGVLLAMVLVTVLVTSPWMSDGDKVVRAPAGSQPQPPQCGLNTRGEAQTLPCDPGDGNLQLTEKVVVAQGDLETNHWQLEVYQSEAGLCVDLRIGPGAAGGCGSPTDPVGVGVSRFGGVSWLHGPVRKDVAKIRIVLADGQVLEVSPVGTSAGFPVNFYVVAVPSGIDAVQVISVDENGDEIARQVVPQLPSEVPRAT